MNEIVILTTVDSIELGRKIAGALVDAGLAACVNIVPGLRSIYRWQGKTCDEEELLLLIKTTAERFEDVRGRIRDLHTYQVPEIISLPVCGGDRDYISWLRDQVAGSGGA
jgi:periplasmic divalent cation tolerance protein